ncbi:MAG: LPS export ABC transporter periplasmic protein LptC [Burkholderiales bacterium]
MNGARSSDRLRLLILIMLSAAMALGSLWVSEVMRSRADHSALAAMRTDPDYFVEKFNFVRTSKIGQARYAISGAKLTHFPKEDNFEIELPVLKSLSVDRPWITMRAQRAIANGDASQVQMIDDVHIDRPPSKSAPDFHLRSDYMLIFPDDDMMKTDKPVEIVHGTTKITGEGMLANNATLNFTLFHHTNVIVQPQRH